MIRLADPPVDLEPQPPAERASGPIGFVLYGLFFVLALALSVRAAAGPGRRAFGWRRALRLWGGFASHAASTCTRGVLSSRRRIQDGR